MGLRELDVVDRIRPFQVVGLDLLGPLNALEMAGRSRQVVKVWGALYVCLATKAVACWVMKGYSTEAFQLAHDAHVAVYGTPSSITTDRGSQLVAAGKVQLDWDRLQCRTAPQGTIWRFVPPGSPWRNGNAERMIQILKRTLARQVDVGRLLDALQIQTFFHRACAIANQRPLSARSFGVSDFLAVTPRDLLLGAAPSLPHQEDWQVGLEGELEEHLAPRVAMVESKVREWWQVYSQDVFPLLVEYRGWRRPGAGVDFGAIVLVQYRQRFAKDRWRLGRVLRLMPSRDGLVRSVEVGLRDLRKGARELLNECKAGLSSVVLPVQRLAVVLPGSQQPPEILAELRSKLERQPDNGAQEVARQPTQAGRPLVVQQGEEADEMLDLNALQGWVLRVPHPGTQ